jgi:alpha-tubulin suppressor-like RCC1 family protein
VAVAISAISLVAGAVGIYTTMNSQANPGDCTAATTLCIETITPDQGPAAGGTTVTIAGKNLTQLSMPVFTQITSGYETTCGIAADGYTYCWGRGANGRLGNGGTSDSSTPVRTSDGETSDGKFTQISSGHYVTCGIGAADGWVYCWGQNSWGNLGSTVGSDATTPRAIAQGEIPSGVTATKLIVGEGQVHIIGSNGWIYSWGYNDPRIGDGTTTQRNTPVRLAQGALPGAEGAVTFVDVSSGYQHGCGIIDTGAAYCWGIGGSGRLGNGGTGNQTSPVAVSGGLAFSQISAGTSSTCAVGTDGQAYCWGAGGGGRLGTGNTTDRNTPTVISQGAIPTGVNIVQVSVSTLDGSGNTACAVADNAKAYCWGTEDNGELGDGTTSATRLSPVAVLQGAMPAGFTFQEISAGADHVCTIGGDNLAYCWGYNSYGRLGDGTTTARSTPVKVIKSNDMSTSAPYTITIGGAECTYPVITDTSVTCVTSASQAGSFDVLVSNSIDSMELSNAFSYIPTTASIVPDNGPTVGGTDVQITDDQEFYKRVDGLNFNNPQGIGTVLTTPTQYINTGIPQTGNIKVELQFKIADGNTCNNTNNNTTGTSTMRIFGSWGNAWSDNPLTLQRLSGTNTGDTVAGNRCAFAVRRAQTATEGPNTTTALPMGNNTFDSNVHTWIINPTTANPTGSWDGTNMANPSAALPNNRPASMFLGHINNASSGNGFAGTVYYLKIWKDGILERDMIPVCSPDRTICGMQDKKYNIFYGNAVAGSTNFTAGSFLPDDSISVTFDGVNATNISKLSDYTVQATTPAHQTGAVDVVVIVNGQKVTIPNGYTYRPSVASIDPNQGPVSGGTGFGASHNPNGTITIDGDGFIAYPLGIDPAYVNANKVSYTNPQFSGYTNTAAYGGTVTYTCSIFSSRYPWRVFDKTTNNGNSYNWQADAANNATCTLTLTLPAGQYVNLSSITTYNGYNNPVKGVEFFAGGTGGLSLTGYYTIPTTQYNQQSAPSIVPDIWTNSLTIRATSNGSYVSLQEIIYSGQAVDLSPLNLSSYPTYFNINNLTAPASAVKVGGNNCQSFTVVSYTEITCVPPAGSAGTTDVSVTVNGITSTYAIDATDDDYTYVAPPSITSITPDHGPVTGGTDVTIAGTNFLLTGSTAVTFDGVPATNVVVVNDHTITATTPAHIAGLVDVAISGLTGTATLTDGYEYDEIYVALSSDKSTAIMSPSSSIGGGEAFDSVDLMTSTNNPSGYKLSISTAQPALVCTSGPTIGPLPSTGNLAVGKWGYGVGTVSIAPSVWNGATTAPVQFDTFGSAVELPAHRDTYMWTGVKIDATTPACEYSTTVTITAQANV